MIEVKKRCYPPEQISDMVKYLQGLLDSIPEDKRANARFEIDWDGSECYFVYEREETDKDIALRANLATRDIEALQRRIAAIKNSNKDIQL